MPFNGYECRSVAETCGIHVMPSEIGNCGTGLKTTRLGLAGISHEDMETRSVSEGDVRVSHRKSNNFESGSASSE